ncbi:A-kinase anchor protein 9 [Rhinichthys klamathensis goyatoka]|uniref:A-kinase anchor protein 9 n=1 Tax=Rhinichthys klamathensis goyatoka TaxID=3034132 RepID=UPI0024B52F7C|nr:A-kinase anchor protein 9 [Rhinichthys klamathensis goyatoka]
MSKRRWVEFRICQTISCSTPVGRRTRPASPAAAAAAGTAEMMEDEERQRKLQAGKAKLAEYRQRKAQSDGQKKQKKKRKKPESDAEERLREEPSRDEGDEQPGDQNTVFSLSKTLRSGESVTHEQTYSIEPESEVSTTAEDCSSEVNGFQERTDSDFPWSSCVIGEEDLPQSEAQMEPDPQSQIQVMEDELAAKSTAIEELSRELEEIRRAFGPEGGQQLPEFEEALKQRDEIITQLTANMQQARAEKEEVMREFLQLTEQSQKLQIQFQQLQAGEILRSSSISSSISSTASDLLQARQQITLYQEKITLYQQQLDESEAQVKGHQEKITLYQQQLDDRDAQVRGHQEKLILYQQQLDDRDAQVKGHQEKITLYQQQLDDRDAQVRGHQEKLDERDAQVRGHQEKTQEQLILITQLQERLSEAEKFHTESEESSALSLREKDLLNTEHHQRLISEHQQSITQLQDQLLTSKQQAEEANRRLSAKAQELDICERELTVSRQKERMSSGEILQLMKTVEDLQQRCHHHGSQSERDTLRAELDEMYGEQIVAMKHELRVQHAAEVDRIREQSRAEVEKIVQEHQSEIEKFKGQVFQSNVLNVRVIELQQKLQETLVLREKAEQELARVSGEKLSLAHQVERLHNELRSVRSEVSEVQRLRDALDAAQTANVELEVKHESEITNYKIKLDMLEREKDAVLDRMAESQESELERLRTQLLFSHEEELSRLRDDLQREGQLNVQNLRDEMSVRHREAIDGYEDKLASAESERVALLQALKHNEESGNSEELERPRQSEISNLLEDVNKLTLENEQASARLEELQDEIDTQRNTFSFAERNFQVNFQELKDEYVFMANAKTQLEERLIREAEEFEKRLAEMRTSRDEVDGSEKHTTELMEKLEAVEKEKKSLAERLSLAEADAKRLADELELRNKALVRDCSVSGGLETHHTHTRSGRERETPASTTASRLAPHTHTHTHDEQLAVSFSLTQQHETGDAQVDGDAVRASRVILPLEMDGAEHDECRLQLEAQRISLSQIHAAQLELLMDTHEQELRSREREMRDTHEQELRSRERELMDTHEHELRRLQEQQGLSAPSSEPSELTVPQLKAEFQECRAQLEETHRREIERLKVFYQQQKQETQERFTSEILLLQQRLQELSGAEELFSVPSASVPLTGDERAEQHQDEERVSVIAGSGLWRELQAGQKAPCESWREELTDRDRERRPGSPPGRWRERHQQEQLEEEIAKVIVQMSVEFAQHTEHTRISKQARETSTAVQTDRDEAAEKEEEEEEEEEEVIKGKGHGRSETSQSSDPELASDDIITERDLLREANARLVLVLLEVLKTTAAAEETISHVEAMLEASPGHMTPAERVRPGPAGDADDVSMFSAEADEGLEMKIPGAGLLCQGAELQLQGAELQLEREEFLMSISSRLQSAVEKLLIAITDTSSQLEHARITQTELMREKFRHNEEMEELLRRQEELQERVCEENRAREQLALELHRAEGVIDSYSGEREGLEQQVRERVDLQLQLEQELCVTSLRLRELEEERQQIQDQRQLLSRQQEALRDGAGAPELRLVEAALDAAPEADLLEETEKLMLEKVEVQRQAQKESVELHLQVKHLEAELEDQVMRLQELQDTSRSERDDLRQQIQALEKQLENNRRFMDEQAADREHERDVFQQEIHSLEQQLKNPPKTGSGSDRRDREVQELTRALQDKSDCCSELLLSAEQLQRDVCERDEEIETLGARVRELEHTLMHRVEEAQHVSMAGRGDVTLEAQLQTEREALDRKEKEIVNLEEQLEQFREELENKSEEVNQLNMQLEIQRKEISSHQQDQTRLTQVLEEKDGQIIALNEQVVKHQHTDTEPEEEALEQKEEVLLDLEAQVERLRSEQERLKRSREEEVEQLNAVIETLQQELSHIERKDEPRDESHEMKQKMDEVATELDTLKSEHGSLRSKYERLREETLVELEAALREKTAAFVVVQAQVQALEESAGSRLRGLSRRVEELEAALEDKDSELRACMLNVELAQTDAGTLHVKVADLEDKLREKVAAVLVSQAQLGAVQTQTKDLRGDAPAGEKPKGAGAATHGPVLLTERLRELEEGLSLMQKDQELQKHMLSSSEDEVMEYERRLAVMMDILNQMRTKPTYHRPLIAEESGEDSRLLSQLLQEVKGQAASTKEELTCYRELSHKLQEEMEMKESTITQLQTALSQVQAGSRDEDVAKTAKLLQELQEVRGQASATQQELQEVRGQASAARQELQEVRGQASAARQELHSFREQSVRLQELLQEREMSIALLKDQLHRASREGDRSTDELLQELQEVKGQAADTLQELQEVKGQAAATKEQLSSFRERSLKLQEEIEVRDVSIAELRVKVHELQIALTRSEEPPQQPQSQPKTKAGKNGDNREHHGINKSADASKDTPSLPHRTSTDQSESSPQSRVNASTQSDPSRAEDVQELISGFSEKIGQMRELHAAEIMDMEARHISESESLKRENRQLELESRALRDAIDKLTAAEVTHTPSHGPPVRSERPAASPLKDGYASDSSSDWSQRTGLDHPHLQENRSTPEGARRDPEPDLLPDRVKSLLREVHREGMQVLSLSELPMCGADRPAALQAWSSERDALTHTVDSLQLLISRLQSHTQVDGDWRAELLSAVQQVFVHERDALKSVLYSQLERLDTADAVVHLNQLERALAEQDARHSEGMCVLSSADRSSLRSEIQQLRDQLHTLTSAHTQRHHVDTTGAASVREAEPALVGTSVGSDPLEEIKTELSQTKLELESALKAQHKHLKELDTLRVEVSLKAAEVDTLSDTLAHEQKRAREMQWAYEKEKCKSDRKQESEREEVEDLKLALEDQRGRVVELSIALERERETSARLRDQEREAGVSSELQVQLDAQRARAAEISSALEKEKELNAQLLRRVHTSSASNTQDSGTHTLVQAEASCSQVEAGVLSVESLLQAQLVEKQAQVVQMMEELEKHQLDVVQRKRQWDEERSSLQQDHNALGRRVEELRAELNAERDTVRSLEGERHRLQERVRELEGERHRLQERVRELEEKLRDARPADRTRDWVLQQKTTDATTHTGQNPEPKHTDPILSRLQLIAARINSLTSDTPGRLSGEAPDRESLAWLHSNVQDVMSLLQHIPSAPSALPESPALLAGGSSSLLNERLLRQNAELTGFVSRLTEEKNDLRNQLLNLEDELRRSRQKKAVAESGSGRQELVLFSSERECWAQERSRLQKCVGQAEAELARLRAEIRSDTLRDLTGADPDNTALKRMYGKYLRAESFRKALVYQKKYLLLLLGGFQECEEATLSLIARMGGQPTHTHTHTSLESIGRQRRGFTRFRSAVRVCIALSRMRFLVKRWQRAGGTVSAAVVSRNGLSQITGADVRNESSFLQPGSVEVFRERRGTSRGRTGRDSPRSTASVQHRYHSMAGEPGGLPCSHLQNYDPDRALTDYISRLEALQRRLGSVQSGSSSYAQLHFGVRR